MSDATRLTLARAAALLPGSRLVGDGGGALAGVSIDSRSIGRGELFVALRGEGRDGHDFAEAALQAGAGALLVERQLPVGLPQLVVGDTRRALAALGAAWRARFDLPLGCVTGSNGKTTVTQMTAAILARAFPQASLATRGNLNNSLGVPLMLLGLRPSHRVAVLELGMNHLGEIAPLAAWARPTAALVNNAQREHQEFLESVEATARENGAVLAALGPAGCAVFPADDPCAPVWRALAGTRPVIDFALAGPAAVTARFECGEASSRLELRTPRGEVGATIALAGEHNVRNALAATALSLALGADLASVAAGLEDFQPVRGRGVRGATPGGARLIDETYNANPDSVRAAIRTLSRQPGWRLLALGDMAETGTAAVALHREVGAFAREAGIDALLALGPLSRESCDAFGPGAEHFDDAAALTARASALLARHGQPASVLVKGSRSMRMERVVAALLAPVTGTGRDA